MATASGKLAAVAIKAAGAGKLADGGGLFLVVRANGSRYWRMRYRHAGKERLLAFGVYPEVTLAEARRRRDAAREAIRDGRDPSAERKADKLRAVLSAETTFEAIGREWMETQRRKLAPATCVKSEWLLGNVRPARTRVWLCAIPKSAIAELPKQAHESGAKEPYAYAARRRRDGQPCRAHRWLEPDGAGA